MLLKVEAADHSAIPALTGSPVAGQPGAAAGGPLDGDAARAHAQDPHRALTLHCRVITGDGSFMWRRSFVRPSIVLCCYCGLAVSTQ